MPKRLIPRIAKEDLLRAFLEHVPDGVYFKDRESRFVRISRSLAVRFGLSDPVEAINKTDFDMFRQSMRDRHWLTNRTSSAPVSPSWKRKRKKHGRMGARPGSLPRSWL